MRNFQTSLLSVHRQAVLGGASLDNFGPQDLTFSETGWHFSLPHLKKAGVTVLL